MKVFWESAASLPTQSVRVLRPELGAFTFPLHAHDALELTWIEAGRGVRLVGDSVEPFGPDDLVLLGPRVTHTWLTSGEQDGPVRATVLQLLPRPELTGCPEWQQDLAPLLAHPHPAWVVEGALAETTKAALAALPSGTSLIGLGQALALLGNLAGASTPGSLRHLGGAAARSAASNAQAARRLEGLLAWIRSHLHTELRVADAAAHLHVTPAAFSRSFQRQVGKPFSVYVNDLRIAEACLLLRQSDRPVAEVAARCGYLSLSHFNRHFRQRLGLTPREYRARVD